VTSDAPAAIVRERRHERRHVEEVAQALAVGFEQHWKRSVARRDRQQIGGALALLPERRAHARAALRQQQRTRGVLANFRGEQRRRAQLAARRAPALRRDPAAAARVGRRVHVRKSHHEPIVAPERFDVDARFLANLARRAIAHGA
jgi:hypothetical protein